MIRELKDVEKDHVAATLKELNYNKMKTARALGISIRGLRNKIARWGWTHLIGPAPRRREPKEDPPCGTE